MRVVRTEVQAKNTLNMVFENRQRFEFVLMEYADAGEKKVSKVESPSRRTDKTSHR